MSQCHKWIALNNQKLVRAWISTFLLLLIYPQWCLMANMKADTQDFAIVIQLQKSE